jgi:hypothetical protein
VAGKFLEGTWPVIEACSTGLLGAVVAEASSAVSAEAGNTWATAITFAAVPATTASFGVGAALAKRGAAHSSAAISVAKG